MRAFARLRQRLSYWSMVAADRVIARVVPPAVPQDRLLVVRLDAIGDFVLWIEAARTLRRIHGDMHVVLAGNAVWADVASRSALFDEVWPIDVASFQRPGLYRMSVMLRVRRYGFRRVVQPTYSRWPTIGDALVAASGAPERIGSSGDLSNMTERQRRRADLAFTTLIPASTAALTEIERNAEFVSALGAADVAPTIAQVPPLGILDGKLRRPVGSYLVVFPGASSTLRQWPASHFADVANRFARERDLEVVVCGSATERTLCDEVVERLAVPAMNLAGESALWELFEIIRAARLLIANETSATHIAAAVGTPCVCIVGGGHFGRFVPYAGLASGGPAPVAAFHRMPCFGCNWLCTQPHAAGDAAPCVQRVSPDLVRQLAVDADRGVVHAAHAFDDAARQRRTAP